MYYPKAHYCRKEVGDYLNLYIFPNTVVFVCALIGFGYGIRKLVRGKKAVFPKMVTGAVGCIALGRMYQLVKMATGGRIEGEFQLGILGVLGCMMFFFSANFGLMDKIADDGSKELRKYRIAAFAAPALSLTIFLTSICFSDIILPIKILAGAATVFIMPASYFNLKHFLLPDVDLGIIKCLKSYNLLVLIFCFLSEAEMIALIYKIWDLEWLIAAAMGIVILGIVPSVKNGMDKWTS